jgi:hypothetical protein
LSLEAITAIVEKLKAKHGAVGVTENIAGIVLLPMAEKRRQADAGKFEHMFGREVAFHTRESLCIRFIGKLLDVDMAPVILSRAALMSAVQCYLFSSHRVSDVTEIIRYWGIPKTNGEPHDVRQLFVMQLARHVRKDAPDSENGWGVTCDRYRNEWIEFKTKYSHINLYEEFQKFTATISVEFPQPE